MRRVPKEIRLDMRRDIRRDMRLDMRLNAFDSEENDRFGLM